MAAERIPEPTPEQQSAARLAAAARTLLRDVPQHAANFGWAAAMLMGEPDGDARIAGMIEFSVRIAESGRQLVDDDIEKQSGMPVVIQDPEVYGYQRPGILVALEGTDDKGDGRPLIYGVAVVKDPKGKESFMRVAITQHGQLFAKPVIRFNPDYKKIV